MTPREDALRVAALKALRDKIDAALDFARLDLFDDLTEMHDEAGVRSLDVMVGDTVVATVSLTVPKPGPHVEDREAYIDFITEHHPSAIERKVSYAFEREHMKRIAETGELVPGVEWRTDTTPTTFSTRFKPNGRDAIASAVMAGELSMRRLMSLSEGRVDGE